MNVEFNKTHRGIKVTILDYQEITPNGTRKFTWITDFSVTDETVYLFMRGGRARWKVENETFNTLKNQGYHQGRFHDRQFCSTHLLEDQALDACQCEA